MLVTLGMSLGALIGIATLRWSALAEADPSTFQCSSPQVVDGDTLRCGSIRVRLAGIDAPPPAVVEHTTRVEVPVPVACVDRADIPAEPPRVGGRLTGDARHDLDLVSASALRLRAALGRALALLGACVR